MQNKQGLSVDKKTLFIVVRDWRKKRDGVRESLFFKNSSRDQERCIFIVFYRWLECCFICVHVFMWVCCSLIVFFSKTKETNLVSGRLSYSRSGNPRKNVFGLTISVETGVPSMENDI